MNYHMLLEAEAEKHSHESNSPHIAPQIRWSSRRGRKEKKVKRKKKKWKRIAKEASFLVIAKCLHKLDQYRLHETD